MLRRFLIHSFVAVVVLLLFQSIINNTAVLGQIYIGEGISILGKITADPTKAISEMIPPINSHFHASTSPIKPIPTMENPIMSLVLKGPGSPDSGNNL